MWCAASKGDVPLRFFGIGVGDMVAPLVGCS
jgi:hypothetical protein